MKNKKLSKYEIEAIILIILAFILIYVSLLPYGISGFTGVLQGIATGLISGIVLLLITGQKYKDEKALNSQYYVIHSIGSELFSIGESYSKMYHETYHRKKESMAFNKYFEIINVTYKEYESAYKTMRNLDITLIRDKNIKKNIDDYINELSSKLDNINLKISNITGGDKNTLDDLRDTFYEIQYQALKNHYKCYKLEQNVYEKKKIIKNSWI